MKNTKSGWQNDSAGHEGGQPTGFTPPCKAAPRELGVYVHIPFCVTKCPYCDFYTRPLEPKGEREPYVRALLNEIRSSEEAGWQTTDRIVSVFLGGGTPSLLPGAELRAILTAIRERFQIDAGAEITMEINPETVSTQAAREWREAGINRASMGVQSTLDSDLKRLSRGHSGQEARVAYDQLREAGFENVSVDLMFGLEGQSVKNWQSILQGVIAWKPNHISAYNLTVEERTPFGSELRTGKLHLPSEGIQYEMLKLTHQVTLEAGLAPYEISNFARPGFESRHNLLYWTGKPYWGVGVSSHSFQRQGSVFRRWWNIRDQKRYVDSLLLNERPPREEERLTPETHLGERLMTGLRLMEGLDVQAVAQEIGAILPDRTLKTLDRYLDSGHLQKSESRYRLTDNGIPISNEIFRDLL